MRPFRRFFLGNDNEEIDNNFEILYDTNVFENDIPSINICQILTQECTLRQVEDILAAIKFKCEERDRQLVQHTHAILTRVLTDIHKIRIQGETCDLHPNMMFQRIDEDGLNTMQIMKDFHEFYLVSCSKRKF